jgi:anaerobic dimethyl sulfoxide reductase subunit A
MANGTKQLSRRHFVQAAAASAALLAVAGCSPGNKVTKTELSEKTDFRLDPELDPAVDGKWVPVTCAANCGGACSNKAYVVDNIIIRTKTDDTHEDDPGYYPQRRSCIRGRSQRRHFFGPERLKYPMKRASWSAEKPNGNLRGKDEWERITWDEAYTILADQIKTTYEKYGMSSILALTSDSAGLDAVLNTICGGFTNIWSTGSEGIFRFRANWSYGYTQYGDINGSDIQSMMEVEHLIMYGANPVWTSGGTSTYIIEQARKAGAKFYSVGPMYDASASLYDAEWFPVRAGTDNAFLAATAYVMLQEDNPSSNPLIDWDFLNNFTLGFDAEHMPPDAKLSENFKGYILGEYDGIPKTPEWASEICGTPVDKIKAFARLLGKDNKTYIGFSYGTARRNGAESFGQMLMTLSAMGGHFGKPGHGSSSFYYTVAGNDGYRLVTSSSATGYTSTNTCDHIINTANVWDAILDGKYIWNGAKVGAKIFTPGEVRDINIRMVYFGGGATMATQPDILKCIRALRTVDFVVSQSLMFRPEAQYADLVIPVASAWERPDELPKRSTAFPQRESAYVCGKACEPYFEARSDMQIARELLEKLGGDPATVFPLSETQVGFNQIAAIKVIKDGASKEYEPLVTITEADLSRLKVEGKPQQGRITYDEFLEAGCYTYKRSKNDGLSYINLEEYVADPAANPRQTTSGKMEIYSQRYADLINTMGYDSSFSIKPYPTHATHARSYDKLFQNGDIANGKRAKYGYQVFNPHYLRSSHAMNGNVDWLQEAWAQPVFINATNAKEKGIANGDTVLIYNDFGKVLRHAVVTETIMPYELALPHGGWLEYDEDKGMDIGGSDNVLTDSYSTAGVSAYNSVFADIVKYDGEPLVADHLRENVVAPCQMD